MSYGPEQAGNRLIRYLHDREQIGGRLDGRRGDLAAELVDLSRAVSGLGEAEQEIVKWFIFKGALPSTHATNTRSDLKHAEELTELGRMAEADRYLQRRTRNRFPRPSELRGKLSEALEAGNDREAMALQRTLRQVRVLYDVAAGLSGKRRHDFIRRTSGKTCNGPCRRCGVQIDHAEEVWYDRADHTLIHVACPGLDAILLTVVETQAICSECEIRISFRMLCWTEPATTRFWHCDCLGLT